MSKYQLVTQKSDWGCGVACVASLLGIDYEESLERLEHYKENALEDRPQGLDAHEIVWCLSDYDLWYIADWRRPTHFTIGSIICIRGEQPYESDHYLLMTPNGWMDPWHNIPKKEIKAGFRRALPLGCKVIFTLSPKDIPEPK